MKYTIPELPLSFELETKRVLKKLAAAHRSLAELKGVTEIIPNQGILINTLALQEAKESSAIENIITTQDDLYQSDFAAKKFNSLEAKEVYNYAEALHSGFAQVKKNGLLTNGTILDIQRTLVSNNAGFRKLPGTELIHEKTGAVVYSPPQDGGQIELFMTNLEKFINDSALSQDDPLIKMAVIHHQFESIHPFYDGNGRTGRIINVLYLVKEGLLKSPILYLSRYINQNKQEYYRLLQEVRMTRAWEEWLLYVLEGVDQTARQTTSLIHAIKKLMQQYKDTMRNQLPKIYSQDLLNNLFRHPYTKIDFVMNELQIHRNTATKYLEELVAIGLLVKHKVVKENFYLNVPLFDLLQKSGKST